MKELIIGQHINIIIVKISFLDSMKGEPSERKIFDQLKNLFELVKLVCYTLEVELMKLMGV